jgi:rubrerythrin
MGLESLQGDEEPRDIIVFAYGMEESLGGFYREAAGRPDDSEVGRLFLKLAGMEEKHKDQLFLLYRNITGTGDDREAFEAAVVPGALEGGFSKEEFAESIAGQEYSLNDVFSIAMMFEAQAMDLYMRYSEKVEQADAKTLLHDLAQQEKAHLRALGELMDRKSYPD